MGPVNTDILFDYVQFNDADELAEALENRNIDPNSTNSDKWSLLHIACQLGRLDCVKVLLNDTRTNVNIKGPNRITPLLTCITKNQSQCMQELLKHPKININICNDYQQTPLHYSILNDKVEFVKLLVANPNISFTATDENGKTASDLAKESQSAHRKEILELLGVDDTKDYYSEEGKSSQISEEAHNLVLTQRDEHWRTALHLAAEVGDVERLKILLNIKGIDVNMKAKHDWTPLHYAAHSNHAECIKVLLTMPDININAQTSSLQWTPLHYAVYYEHPECVRVLVNAPGINANLTDESSLAPIHYAAHNGSIRIMKVLLSAECVDVNIREKSGNTPLTEAELSYSPHKFEIVNMLREHGAVK